MQQTTKYKLNLIEPEDPFLPDALNANTQRLEDVLIDRMEGSLDAMDQRVTVLEGHKFACGWCRGTGMQSTLNVDLGFRPSVVMTFVIGAPSRTYMMVENSSYTNCEGLTLAINGCNTTGTANSNQLFYVAFI